MNAFKTLMIAGALCAVGTAALAQQAQYREIVTNSSGFPTPYGASAPHASPLTLNLVGHDPRLTGQIQFVSTPAPSVFVRVTADGVNGDLGAELRYTFDVTGPSNAFVPIAYTAHFNLSPENFLAGASAQFTVMAYSIGFGVVGAVSGNVSCGQSCQASAQPSDSGSAQSTIAIHYDGIGANAAGGLGGMAAYGTFSGVLMAPTNAAGLGMGYVYLDASASGNAAQVGANNTSWAFIDPRFEVLPSYLATNPDAGLQILAGVGNESGTMPVPEPGAALLMLIGLAGLVAARRAVQPSPPADSLCV